MSLYDLLPPNSTQLERDLSRAVSFLPKIERPVSVIRTAKRFNYPPSVLPWLVYEYGLGEISGYFDSLVDVIEQGIPWQRIRGTPLSIQTALSWIGLDSHIDESEAGSYRWSEYQIELHGVPSDQRIKDAIFLAGVSTPVRSRLNRIYYGYDFRRFVLDDSLLSGGAILSDHSGVRPDWADGVQLSFGRLYSDVLVVEPIVELERSAERDVVVTLADTWRLDHSILGGTDDELAWHVLNEPFTRDREITDVAGGSTRIWDANVWDNQTWDQSGFGVDGLHDTTV